MLDIDAKKTHFLLYLISKITSKINYYSCELIDKKRLNNKVKIKRIFESI